MGATPKSGTCTFKKSDGTTFSVPFYCSDVSNEVACWDSGGGATATSQNWWSAPCDVELIDVCVTTGMADTHSACITRNNAPVKGGRWQHVLHLNTVLERPKMGISFAAGENVGMIQSTGY